MQVTGRHAARKTVSAHPRAAVATASPAHRAWLANIDTRGIDPQAVAGVVRQHGITRDSFRALDALEEINDPSGKSYFLIPRGVGGDDARDAALLTYLLNVGTGYVTAGQPPGVCNDFPDTPYCADEVRRIIGRQRANRWSYDAVRLITGTGGQLAATPNGVLMGLGGNWIHAQFSRRGGTMWGDLFLVNTDRGTDPALRLRRIIESGRLHADGPGLDRLLHHEERHAQQWAQLGRVRMSMRYLAEEARVRMTGGVNRFEEDAGLADGGYP